VLVGQQDVGRAPAVEAIGPFRIVGVLGRGGMGVVFHGQHGETGVHAAIKTILAPTPNAVSAIRREIRSLSRLQHPGIVRIIASGVSDGSPWYAMERLVGRTLRDYLAPIAALLTGSTGPRSSTSAVAEAGQTNAALLGDREPRSSVRAAQQFALRAEAVLALVAAVCKALAYLHENGIVHRDLKPENIFVQASGPPVLVDLGISGEFAGARGREQLDGAWFSRLGTLAYMSPEQIRGEVVDARADLYAVGCILYECATGQKVFPAMDAFALRNAHLTQRPVPPSQLAADVPAVLDQLVLQLLEKEPEERIGYADDVARALLGLLAAPTQQPPVPARYLYRPPFVGRAQATEQLQAAIGALARNGSGGTLFLRGESGVGKTRLANEAVFEASRLGANIVLGQCSSIVVGADAHGSGAPLEAFGPMLLAIADACRQSSAGEIERLLGAHGRLLATYQPALAELPGFALLPEPEQADGQEARTRVLAAAARAILNFTAGRPVLLVIDDLQWADELSLALLRRLAEQGLEDSGLLILGTYRADEAGPSLRELVASASADVIELQRFGGADIRAMVQGMLARRHVEATLVEYLASQSNGNPFFVVEHLRTAIEAQLLVRDARGRWQLTSDWNAPASAPLPSTLQGLIERRLLHLEPDAKRLLELASVLGREFDTELLQHAAGLAADAALDAWASLREKQILEDAEGGRVRFVHDALREAAYSQIAATELRQLHASAATSIETTYRDEALELFYADLAHHHSRSLARRSAAHYYELAGARAQRGFATAAAVRHFQNALAESEPLGGAEVLAARARLQEALGELLLFAGDAPNARSYLEAAIEANIPPGPVARARRMRKLARTLERQHRHADALGVYQTAEQELGAPPGTDAAAYWYEFVQIQVDAAWDLYFMARVDDLDALALRVQEIVERHGDPAQRSRFFTSMAQSLVKRARFRVGERALHFTRLALAVGEESSDPRERAVAEFAGAFPLALHGDYAAAETLFLRAVAGAERVGDTALLTRVLAYYGVLLRRVERVSETRSSAERTLRLAEKMRMVDYLGVAHANLAWVAHQEQDGPECERHSRCSLEAWAKLPASYVFPLQWLARLPYAEHSSRRGNEQEALVQLSFLLRDDQMALEPDIVSEIARCAASPADRRASLETIWRECREHKYL
jgi:serine/threonine protein kinase